MISSLKENQIFVFGSNLGGVHAGGAAKQAKEQFGAAEGVSCARTASTMRKRSGAAAVRPTNSGFSVPSKLPTQTTST